MSTRTRLIAGLLAGSTLLGTFAVAPTAMAQDEDQDARRAERTARIQERLDQACGPEGRLSAEQCADIEQRMADRQAKMEERQAQRQAQFEELAATLEMTTDELREAKQNGQSLADIAEAQQVDIQIIINAMVEAGNAKIDELVANERLSSEEAVEARATLEERITARVNGEQPDRPEREGRRGGMGRFGPRGDN